MWSLELLAACVVPLGPRGSEVRSGGTQVWGVGIIFKGLSLWLQGLFASVL